jgi:delta14-sterol reductase
VLLSVALVLPAPRTGRSVLADLYFGRSENPQLFGHRVDVKMFLYLLGAVMLALNLLSFTAHHVLAFGSAASPGIGLYSALFLWFVIDYLVFERVHLYTYDIFAERVGFKLGWGCFTFYSYFYVVGLWAVADRPDPGTPSWLLVIYVVVFFAGWSLSRGANMQKYTFDKQPDKVFLGFMKPSRPQRRGTPSRRF